MNNLVTLQQLFQSNTSTYNNALKSTLKVKTTDSEGIEKEIEYSVDKTLESYHNNLTMTEGIKSHDLVNLFLEILQNTVLSSVKNTASILWSSESIPKSIKDDLNSQLKKLDLLDRLSSILGDLILYGSYTYYLTDEFEIRDLTVPYFNVGFYHKGNKTHSLILTSGGKLEAVDIKNTLALYSDNYLLSTDNLSFGSDLEDSIFPIYQLKGSKPLFYGIFEKLKRYILKDLISNHLEIRELLMSHVMIMGVDDPEADPNDITSLCNSFETLLNSMFNFSSMEDVDLSKVMQTLNNNIKIIPDKKNLLSSLDKFSSNKVIEDISSIRSALPELQEYIATAIGIPLELLQSGSNRYEIISRASRLSSKIEFYTKTIESCVGLYLKHYAESIHKIKLKASDFKVDIFSATSESINKKTALLQTYTDLIDLVKNIKEDTPDNIQKLLTDYQSTLYTSINNELIKI